MSSGTSTTPSTSTSPSKHATDWRGAAAIAALLALTFLFWGRFFFGGLVFYARDLGFFFAPLRAAWALCLRHGSAPLWNPLAGCGIPLAADPNAAAFFPPTLLFLLPPLSNGIRAAYAVYLLALPLGAYAGLRLLGVGRASAAVGAGAISISGPALALTTFPHVGWNEALFLPFAALCWRAGRGSGRAALAAALLLACSIAAGEPAVSFEWLAGAAIFLAARPIRRSLLVFAAVVLLGAAAAAPQIVAAASLLPRTVRGAGLATKYAAAFFSVSPLRLFAFLWPRLFGDVASPLASGFWGSRFFDAGAPYVSSLAVGTVVLLLAPAAAKDPRGRRLLAFAAVAVALSLGRHLPGGALFLRMPGLSLLRYPEKWLVLASVALVAAFALALDAPNLRETLSRGWVRRWGVALAGVSALLAAATAVLPVPLLRLLSAARIADAAADPRIVLPTLRADALSAAFFAAVALLLPRLLRHRPRLLPAALAAALFLDLFPRTWNATPLARPERFDVAPPAAAAARRTGGRLYFAQEERVALDPLRPLTPNVWGVPLAGNNDVDRFSPARSFLFGLELRRLALADPRTLPLLRLADVSTVSTEEEGSAERLGLPRLAPTSPGRALYGVSGAARWRLVGRAVEAPDERAALAAVLAPGFDPDRAAVVEGAAPSLPGEGGGAVVPLLRRPDRESVEVRASSPALLVRSETFDPHWRARLDGKSVPIIPADAAFQAVAVPAGSHVVAFRYEDGATPAAMGLSLGVLAAIALGLSARP